MAILRCFVILMLVFGTGSVAEAANLQAGRAHALSPRISHGHAESMATGDSGVSRVKRSDDASVSSLETLVQQQGALIQTLQAELASEKSRVAALESTVQVHTSDLANLKNKLSKQVAFTVRYHNDDYHYGIALSPQAVLKFDTVITNVGNAYDRVTGIFTAPVAGTYAFFLSQMSVNSHDVLYLAIVKHGAVLDLVYAEGSGDTNDQGSSQVTTHLANGEQVWVRQNIGDAVRGSWFTIFSGYLLQAD